MLGLTQSVDPGSRDTIALTPNVHLSRQFIFSLYILLRHN